MKLYTEEQIKEIYFSGFNKKYKEINIDFVQNCIDSLTPIELPTDEEIEERVGQYHYEMHKYGFRDGAKWIKEKLKNQQP